jgi:hypothetical protein
MQLRSGLLCALLLAGCGDDGGAAVDAPRPDVAEGPATCSTGGVSRPLVVSINGDEDAIQVFGLDGGTIVDANLKFNPVENPDDVAIRDDGLEALVSFGGFGQMYGVVVLEIGLGGQSARVKQTLEIGSDRVVWGVAYADDDHAVLATAAGPTGHSVTALERGTSGDFAAGMSAPVPDDWPLGLEHRPGHAEVVLARSNLASDTATDFYQLRQQTTGAWTPNGNAAKVDGNPLFMALAPDGNTLLTGTSDPADPISSSNLDGKGVLHAVALGDAGFGQATTISIPGPASMISVDPHGAFAIADSPIYELDPNTGTPITHTRRIFTVALAGGTLGAVQVEAQDWPALLLYGLEVVSSGHVVRSRQLYPDQAPESEQTPIEVLLPDGNGNFMTCSTRFLPGQGRFAVGR